MTIRKFVNLNKKFAFIFFTASLMWALPSKALVSEVQQLVNAQDDIGLRAFLRKNFKKKLNAQDWFKIRNLLQKRPHIGFDLLRAWDVQVSLKGSAYERESTRLTKNLDRADSFMLTKKYSEAFSLYQSIAKYIKNQNRGRVSRENQQLYLSVLHQMGRSLYALKRYDEAIEVYSWIPPVYSQIRQVMFEKMWAAFRGNRYDVTLGSIASQQSDFFSRYLDPESYLIKVYVLKKLCRNYEVKLAMDGIKTYLKLLKKGDFSYLEWARNDLYRLSLAKLLENEAATEGKKEISLDLVGVKERQDEIARISGYLKRKFEEEKPQLISALEKVLGYAALALTEDQKLLSKVSTLPESNILAATGFEYWPAHSSEEWADEIGSHYFIGDSQCQSK